MKILPEPIEFDWDKGNIDKNYLAHNVTNQEAEEIFIEKSQIILGDEKHSLKEKRYMLCGTTAKGRKLAVIFTIRNDKVRIISARDMNIKERRAYEKKLQTDTHV